ncbi:aspartate-semialdehyde dehydrogenase [Sulfidibacter corallicola]|uniref:aspartate-semialdehyde dehydrogenase n=1 Tax=Sulfidibacter corallicola TaxID=2818388 RepID=A0A8A4TIB1_SULCO|nr:aspartate-semialdehyde dehydrogenase [Sulfidibacter corallicola]QTD48518.1 aspartate-semialdehyde dehydrogenase [Sulfidibacter corallicola]
MTAKKKAAILGATGAVGQRFVQLLEGHPQFEITHLCASDRNAGKRYGDAVNWQVPGKQPHYVDDLVLRKCEPDFEADIAFSALPSDRAKEVEPAFAAAGIPVVSNASAYRMGEDIPLLIPEINPDHTKLIEVQRRRRGWKGYIVTNPNCSTLGLALPLKALDDAFGLRQVNVVTLQAKSGAGYPGPAPEIIGDNVLPLIRGEEDKIESEPQKILGLFEEDGIRHHDMAISAQCHRVDVIDGHTEALNINLSRPAPIEEICRVLGEFRGEPQRMGLHSAPERPVVVRSEDDRPQPKLDLWEGNGMSVSVGRVRPCPIFDLKMVILSHNTVRGAAGAALLNAELLLHQGYL